MMANRSSAGIHNHLSPPVRASDPNRDRIWGNQAPIIEDVPIEVGSGALLKEAQLAEHVLRIRRSEGDEAALTLINKLFASSQVNQRDFRAELESRGLAKPIPKAARRALEELKPSGAPN